MRTYLLLFLSTLLLLFAFPKNSSLRRFAQQDEFKKSYSYSKRTAKKPCPRKCLKHQAHPNRQNNAAGIATDCNQQLFAVLNSLQPDPTGSFKAKPAFMLPHIRKHRAPVMEQEPEPPQFI